MTTIDPHAAADARDEDDRDAAADAERARADMAARVRGNIDAALDPEAHLRQSAQERRAELARVRTERDALNDRIRDLVAEVEVLDRAVAVFDRANAKRANGDG